jgi:hypothetical protein
MWHDSPLYDLKQISDMLSTHTGHTRSYPSTVLEEKNHFISWLIPDQMSIYQYHRKLNGLEFPRTQRQPEVDALVTPNPISSLSNPYLITSGYGKRRLYKIKVRIQQSAVIGRLVRSSVVYTDKVVRWNQTAGPISAPTDRCK